MFKWFSPHQEVDLTQRVTENLQRYAQMITFEVFQKLQTDEKGLVGSEAKERLQELGKNEISMELPPTWYDLLLRSYLNPFNVLLTVLMFITYFLADFDATIVIAIMVTLSVGIRFIQEFRSNLSAEKLKSLVSTKAVVVRRADAESPSTKIEIPFQELVPGDIIFLSAGDMVPADLFLFSSKELSISQSALTGEAMPVDKSAIFIEDEAPKSLLDTPNICFTGTNVLNGTGLGVVIATGDKTYFGSMAKDIVGERPLTSFDVGINKVTWLLIRFMLIMVPIVFLINGVTKGNWFDALLFAVSVAVGLVPEMMPMIVTSNLAKGALKMAQSKVIVKRLNSIQNLGAMNILCTDKTGTLTQDHIILEKHLSLNGEDDNVVLTYGYLNSYYQTGLKNLLDIAVLEHEEIKQQLNPEQDYRKVDEIPFDFNRRRMSVVVEKDEKRHELICKGAVEEIMQVCTQAHFNGQELPLSEEIKRASLQLRDELNEDGLRVLAVAYKEIPAEAEKEYKVQDENSLTLLGFLAFLDPPKQTAAEAIAELKEARVLVKILTGDNEIITRKICKWVGLTVVKSLSGSEVDSMSDEELKERLDETTIFVKMSPLQKSRVISLLRAKGHTVGFLGDGINDAPALREADVGISVDTAVDIAKESADMIMLEKSLMFLKEGVLEGRKTYGNIIKYVKMAVSSNFGNVFSILGSSLLLPFLPMLPLQLLVQNLLYDASQITIPFDNVDQDFLRKPRKWHPEGIAKFMFYIGPLSSIFDYTTFAILWFVFGANSIANQALFQTGWFVEGLLSQTLIVHMIRTRKIPFIQSRASFPLMLTTILIMAIGVYIPYTYVGASLGMVPLPTSYYFWLIATLIAYCAVVQLVKNWFIRRFHYWL